MVASAEEEIYLTSFPMKSSLENAEAKKRKPFSAEVSQMHSSISQDYREKLAPKSHSL